MKLKFLLSSIFVTTGLLLCASDRDSTDKYLVPGIAKFELGKGAISITSYKNEWEKKKGISTPDENSDEEYKEYSENLEYGIRKKLAELDHLDTSEVFFPDHKNSLKLDLIVNEIHLEFTANHLDFVFMKGNCTLRSWYGKALVEREMDVKHDCAMDLESYSANRFSSETMNEALDSTISQLLHDFLDDDDVITKIKSTTSFDFVDPDMYPQLSLKRGSSDALMDWREAVVTIIREEGHGSACVVSPDGYLITNHHVVEQENAVRVKFFDGSEDSADVVRLNADCDIALLKLRSKSGLKSLTPVNNTLAGIGDAVMVIGTPADTLLGQTVSRGIISGKRKFHDVEYLQTDANINGGNSGGALVSMDGKLIGIVNAKYIGYGIEGIGFAVPASNLFDKLHIEYAADPKPTAVKNDKKKKK